MPKHVHEFYVNRAIVASSSVPFRRLLGSTTSFKPVEESIDLLEEHPVAFAIWLHIMHDSKDIVTTYSCSITAVWEVLETAHKWVLDPTAPGPKAWFEGWYETTSQNPTLRAEDYQYFFQALMFPCHAFDFPKGWAATTKYLAYNVKGHISEERPPGFYRDHLRLPQHIIGALNAAKGRLRTILHRALYDPIESTLERGVSPRTLMSLFAYETALSKTGAWPVEKKAPHFGIIALMTMLEAFETPEPSELGRLGCREHDYKFTIADFGENVFDALKETGGYFDGLCLDCMSTSNPNYNDSDEEYWAHTDRDIPWDRGCRVGHDEPTWYFSFMGKTEKRIE